jgi:hypothetical protein
VPVKEQDLCQFSTVVSEAGTLAVTHRTLCSYTPPRNPAAQLQTWDRVSLHGMHRLHRE